MNNLDHAQIQFVTEIKEKVRAAQYEALKAVNVRLINFSMGGFSTTNLWYMVQFYNEYSVNANLQPVVGEISCNCGCFVATTESDTSDPTGSMGATKSNQPL